MNLPSKPPQMNITDIPFEAGCLCVLTSIDIGPAVHAAGAVPAALIGSKWPDVRHWAVLLWQFGIVQAAHLCTETAEPWSLEQLLEHRRIHSECWTQVAINKGTA